MNGDRRICFVGDSFVAGVGDPHALGWAGRLTAHALAAGEELTTYNLGVRGHTSTDIAGRWPAECRVRLPAGIDARVVFSFGVNDTVLVGDRPRVDAQTSVANLSAALAAAREQGWRVLMAGPPPVGDPAHNRRIAELDRRFARVCAAFGVEYVGNCAQLARNEVWMEQVRTGDGAHPGAAGYAAFAGLLLPAWRAWLGY